MINHLHLSHSTVAGRRRLVHTPGPLIAESMKLLRYHDTLTIPGLILLDF
ncbi:unnamed protein product [Penicillium salamii]|nr:unnamed protein product [Penicillium salamii]